jgi:hypothetical protein
MKDGHLFLSLMADGGIYDFEPTPKTAAPAASGGTQTTSSGPSFDCAKASGAVEKTICGDAALAKMVKFAGPVTYACTNATPS